LEKQTVKITKNGINIYSYKNPASHGFFISLYIRAGVLYEREREVGITHFFEHAAIRNVNKIMDMKLYSELDRLGLEFNGSTFSEMVQFYISGATKNFISGAEILSKILSPIALSKAEIDAERRRIKAEIRESDDKNSLASFTSKLVFSGTSLASSIVGTNSSVDRINASTLEAYRKEVMTSGNVFLYVTGNFLESDLSALSDIISGYDISESEPRANMAAVPRGFLQRCGDVYIKSADFTMVRFTFDLDMAKLSVPVLDLVYDILLSGYNSRLFIEMSEKRGLFYDVNGAVERYSNIGSLYFSYEVKERDIYDAIRLTVSVLSDMKNRTLSAAECMKAGYVDNALMLYDDNRELNFSLAYDNCIMNLGYPTVEDRRMRYAAITAEDIRKAADEIFRKENLTVTVKGNKKRIDTEKIKSIIGDGL